MGKRVVAFDIGVTHLAYIVLDFPDGADERGNEAHLNQHAQLTHLALMDLRSDVSAEPLHFNESRCCHKCTSAAHYGRASTTSSSSTTLYEYVCGRHRGGRAEWSTWTALKEVKVAQLSIQEIHQRLYAALIEELPHLWPLDVLLIEHQPTSCTIGGRRQQTGVLMKTVGTMLYSFFLCQDMMSRHEVGSLYRPCFQMHFVHAADRWYIPRDSLSRPDSVLVGQVPPTYAERKKQSAEWFWHVISTHPEWVSWKPTCERLVRIHDVADALFLACGWFLKSERKRVPRVAATGARRKLATKRGRGKAATASSSSKDTDDAMHE